MSSTGINAYMERHRIGPLFEDLMNKVLRDMPDEPMVYLLRAMYKKAGMEIPQGIRYGGLRKSTSDFRSRQSPERAVKSAHVSRSVDTGGAGASRDYDKPWSSPTRRIKPKRSDEVPSNSKHKAEWNPDVKTKASSFDDLWQDPDTVKKAPTASTKKSPTKQMTSSANAWANIGVQDQEEVFTSPKFQGPGGNKRGYQMSEDELLAAETVQLSLRSETKPWETSMPKSSNRHRGPRLEAQRHREELATILSGVDKDSDDSGVDVDLTRFDDGDAIELLEDADDLRREGVTNIPKSGYRLSKALRYRENEPKVKLSINVNPSRYSSPSLQAWDDSPSPYDAFNSSSRTSPEQGLSDDDEFESVSQVTGPRHPVWRVPDTDAESMATRPTYSSQRALQSSVSRKSYVEKNLADAEKGDASRRSLASDQDLAATGKPWTTSNQVSFEEPVSQPFSSRSTRSETSSGGWMVPEDTEAASAHDWNQRVRGAPRQDPRSY